MKATMFVVSSLFVLSLSTHAFAIEVNQPLPPITLIEEQVIKKIDLNHADVQQLTGSFKGIGKKRAEAIVSYRESVGGFKSIADLAHVRGLGQSFVTNHLPELERIFSVG